MDLIPTNEQLHALRDACSRSPDAANHFFASLGCSEDAIVLCDNAAADLLPSVADEGVIATSLHWLAKRMSLAGIADEALTFGEKSMPADLYESLLAVAGSPPHPLAAVRCAALLGLLRDPGNVRAFRPLATSALKSLVNEFPAITHPRWQYRLHGTTEDAYVIRCHFACAAIAGNQDLAELLGDRGGDKCVRAGVSDLGATMYYEILGNQSERQLHRTMIQPEALKGLMKILHVMPSVLQHPPCEHFMASLLAPEATMCWANDNQWANKGLDILPVSLRSVEASILKETPAFRREFSAGARYALRKTGLDEPLLCTKRLEHFLEATVDLKVSWAPSRLDAARIAATELFRFEEEKHPIQSQLRPWQASPPAADCIGVLSTLVGAGLPWGELKAIAESCPLHDGWTEAVAAVNLKHHMEHVLRSDVQDSSPRVRPGHLRRRDAL
jgi:hypothetical protein